MGQLWQFVIETGYDFCYLGDAEVLMGRAVVGAIVLIVLVGAAIAVVALRRSNPPWKIKSRWGAPAWIGAITGAVGAIAAIMTIIFQTDPKTPSRVFASASMHVDCSSAAELCAPAYQLDITVANSPLIFRLSNFSRCGPMKLHVALDGKAVKTTDPLDWSGDPTHGFEPYEDVHMAAVSTGNHSLEFQGEGIHAGCDLGHLDGWEGGIQFLSRVIVRNHSDKAPAFGDTLGEGSLHRRAGGRHGVVAHDGK